MAVNLNSTGRTSGSGSGARPNPALYKTVICRNWRSGQCSYGARCAFAHGADELRQVRLAHCTRLLLFMLD